MTTKEIKIGNLILGGKNKKILIQGMTNTKTKDVFSTVNQIKDMEKNGCDIVRVAVLDIEDAYAVKEIKKQINIPIVCDIHYDYKLALESINNGADKIRINPGNISNVGHLKEILTLANSKNIPIRIGINGGSLPKNVKANVSSVVNLVKEYIKLFEDNNFYNIVVSVKTTSYLQGIKINEKLSKEIIYPLHIGVTESGGIIDGNIKSTIFFNSLLKKGIGDTIRASFTSDPVSEIIYAKRLLVNLGLRDGINLVSCPTCGRIEYDMISLYNKLYLDLYNINKNMTISIMGCVVNGLGEAKNSDICIIGTKDKILIYKKNVLYKKVDIENVIEEIKNILASDTY
ncbi:MAG: flavodoxin-dependent (E)-4-hydroxy-3-methylbut-2-enyl-diphosphate synthase [Acholeplasmatales bacterium]|jgi:(E)-4-hydroxy-3-methylbut-2-enyl-diphosphate synthase|nr:flavodoxin-dependent (E)-4-hydroxy-3-methylbut-2-enyl-diphosphate synthase [Acholeplasmatales bacterium]